MTFKEKLIELNVFSSALKWMDKNGVETIVEFWNKCNQGHWLLWVAARFGLTPERHKKIVLAVCEIARMVLKYIPEGEDRPLQAIEAAEAWATGDGTIEDVRVAAYAAKDVEAADAAAYAAYAAFVAPDAAYAAYAANAAYAAYAAYVAADAGRDKILKKFADIVRKHLSCPEWDGEKNANS